jgi:molybdate/tungstate transport system permease protein
MFRRYPITNLLPWVPALLLMLFITIPLVAIFYSLDATRIFSELQNPEVIKALSLVFVTSTIATFVSFVLAVPTAYLLATKNFVGKSAFDAVLDVKVD